MNDGSSTDAPATNTDAATAATPTAEILEAYNRGYCDGAQDLLGELTGDERAKLLRTTTPKE